MQQQGKMWVPLMASVGIGAAAYFTMTRGGRGIGGTIQQMVPLMSVMGGGRQKQQPQQSKQMQQSSQPMNQSNSQSDTSGLAQ